jgi:hypothetical protein
VKFIFLKQPPNTTSNSPGITGLNTNKRNSSFFVACSFSIILSITNTSFHRRYRESWYGFAELFDDRAREKCWINKKSNFLCILFSAIIYMCGVCHPDVNFKIELINLSSEIVRTWIIGYGEIKKLKIYDGQKIFIFKGSYVNYVTQKNDF